MNNAELIDTIATAQGVSKADAKRLIDGVIAAIVASAVKGEEISLAGFGKFKVKDSPAREGRNPATGEPMKIAASRKIGFTPAKAVKDALNA